MAIRNNNSSLKIKAGIIISFTLMAVIIYLLFGVFMSPVYVDGESMTPTLQDKQMILLQKALYTIEYNDIIIFKRPNEDYDCVKRVMGMPGDRVKIYGGNLYINGERASDIFADASHMADAAEKTMKSDEYFVLGDNRTNSMDSRSYGAVPKDRIIGKCIFV